MTGWTKNKKANKSESKTNVGPLTRPFAKWTNSSSIAIRVRMTPLSGDQTKQRHPALRRRRKGWSPGHLVWISWLGLFVGEDDGSGANLFWATEFGFG